MNAEQSNNMLLLFEAVREGTLTDMQFDILDQMLARDDDACRFYVDYMNMCTLLKSGKAFDQKHLAVPEMNSPVMTREFWLAMAEQERTAPAHSVPEKIKKQPRELPPIRKIPLSERVPSKLSLYTLGAAAAAILMMVAYTNLMTLLKPTTVGQLMDTHQARWTDASPAVTAGDKMESGEMELLSGHAQIAFNSGVEIIINGPARFELQSDDKLVLEYGTVSCVVPPQAVGFTVGTPSATIVDLGTEFGVIVEPSGRTEAHVFKGEVDLFAGSDPLVSQVSRRLTAGEGSIVDENATLQAKAFSARADAFIRSELIPYEIAVRESSPIAYWRFDTSAKSLGNIYQSKQLSCDFHGNVKVVPGPSLGNGKFCSAIELDGQGSYVYAPKTSGRSREGNGFTYSFWVRPATVRNQDLIAVTNKGTHQYRHFMLDENGRLGFFTSLTRKKKRVEFYGNTVVQTNRWTHVAVSGQPLSEPGSVHITFYVNGEKDVSKTVAPVFGARVLGNFHVGTAPEEGRVDDVLSFDGMITEIAEYDRALTDEEVKSIYSSVR